jgi:hypothetical protein
MKQIIQYRPVIICNSNRTSCEMMTLNEICYNSSSIFSPTLTQYHGWLPHIIFMGFFFIKFILMHIMWKYKKISYFEVEKDSIFSFTKQVQTFNVLQDWYKVDVSRVSWHLIWLQYVCQRTLILQIFFTCGLRGGLLTSVNQYNIKMYKLVLDVPMDQNLEFSLI